MNKTISLLFFLNLYYAFITCDGQKSNEQRAKGNEQWAESNEQQAKTNKQQEKTNEQRAKYLKKETAWKASTVKKGA